MKLEEIRQEIDQVDDALVALLEKRMNLVGQVVAVKKSTGKAVLDTKREAVIFAKAADKVVNKAYQDTIVATFSDILKRSRAYQDKHLGAETKNSQ
ncbi:chorismate mutase [Streptococcus panodentis]|uniref:Chorismate mutase n=1 Tax=Streptococcus panodentis TaxID=1581472 RepID=A0ABS5AX03_9STRE|nr:MULTISPECIES: chorismate mutase [Streptococcus]KXT78407.1 Chorismate mutase I [Streptococcus sp. DD11]MBP2621103.1 chorismate mutase [Streptococcus panodentis]